MKTEMWPPDSEGYYTCPRCDEKINRARELQRAVKIGPVWYHRKCAEQVGEID